MHFLLMGYLTLPVMLFANSGVFHVPLLHVFLIIDKEQH